MIPVFSDPDVRADGRPSVGTLAPGSFAPWTDDLTHIHARSWNTEASYRYCLKVVKDSDPNLALWMHLIPGKQARALAAVYCVARIADDLTDEDQFRPMRKQALSDWLNKFDHACKGEARHPALVALLDSMARFNIDEEQIRAYLQTCLDESSSLGFDSWGQVEEFGKKSFGSMGSVVMGILGLDRTELQYWAERMSVALFITCRLRDLSVDLPRQRVFIPRQHLGKYGLDSRTILEAPGESLALAIRDAAERTRWIYRESYPLVMEAGGYASALLAGVWLGGRSLLRLVDRSAAGLVHSRPGLSVFTFVRTMMGAGLERLPGVLA